MPNAALAPSTKLAILRKTTYFGPKGTVMTPNSFQKIAYAALIVLMFGVTTGTLGGL
jgi:hypothetical protein